MTDANAPGPFKDLVVLELASVLAGPSVGQYFAELGARVIKIENPATGGDVTRTWYAAGEDRSSPAAYFQSCNQGKESVTVDLKSDAGQRALRCLVEQAHVVLTNALPSSAERAGIDANSLHAMRPGLLVGIISGYPEDATRPGYDAIVQAEAGYYHLNGTGDIPVKLPVAFVDVLAAHQLKEALLVALYEQARTGARENRTLHVHLFDAALSGLMNQAAGFLKTGMDPGAIGSEHPMIAPYGSIFRTQDGGLVVLAVGSDRQFQALCAAFAPAMADDDRFKRNADRVIHREALNDLLQKAFASCDHDEVLTTCRTAGIPAGSVSTLAQAVRNAPKDLLLQNGFRHSVARETGRITGQGSLGPAPELGAHTEAVLKEFGRLTEAAIRPLLQPR